MGLQSAPGASSCQSRTRDILLYEVVLMVVWWGVLVAVVSYFLHQKLHEVAPHVAAVIRLRIMH
jgi:hypothetical protein